jgi:hypothetical protein
MSIHTWLPFVVLVKVWYSSSKFIGHLQFINFFFSFGGFTELVMNQQTAALGVLKEKVYITPSPMRSDYITPNL